MRHRLAEWMPSHLVFRVGIYSVRIVNGIERQDTRCDATASANTRRQMAGPTLHVIQSFRTTHCFLSIETFRISN